MKINQLNYEAFAIDYLEGNLSDEDQLVMEEFLRSHPKIKEEIISMGAFELPVFQAISYPEKEKLYKSSRKYYIPILAMAASLFLLVTIGYQWMNNKHHAGSQDFQPTLVDNDPKEVLSNEIEIKTEELFEPEESNQLNESDDDSIINLNNNQIKSTLVFEEKAESPAKEIYKDAENIAKNLPQNTFAEMKTVDDESAANALMTAQLQKAERMSRDVFDIVALQSKNAQPVSNKPVVESVELILYDISESISKTKIAEAKKNWNFSKLIQPESFDGKQLSNIKKAMVPEAFTNLFSRKSAKTD